MSNHEIFPQNPVLQLHISSQTLGTLPQLNSRVLIMLNNEFQEDFSETVVGPAAQA